MGRKPRFWRWLVSVAVLVAVECAFVATVELASIGQAEAQYRDDRYPFLRRQRPQPRGGFFQQLFGPARGVPDRDYREYRAPSHVDSSHAPAARKRDKDVTPNTTIVVMGDGMADWLGYGLEEAFEESPEVAVVRKDKQRSGLLRYDAKSDLDWWHVARDLLTQEKANYVVMMLGASDRENIRERDLAKEAEKQKAEKEKAEQAKQAKQEGATKPDDKKEAAKKEADDKPRRNPNGVVEFRSDRWASIYSRRIDETIAALKSKGVPVFWVGLPSIRGSKSTADASYLNDLFRARAERAGIVFVDVWDGFVDESGKYSSYGPDYEGQTRRLRSSDGVFFTKYGARKLAHYVEREIRRFMANRATPVALPTGPLPVPGSGKPTERPVVGPVVPLTTINSANAEQLLGASGTRAGYRDPIASSVLVNGAPLAAPSGRADDFSWQSSGDSAAAPKATTTAAAPPAPELEGGAPKRQVRQLDMRGGDQTTPDPKPEPKVEPVAEPKQAEAAPPPRPERHSSQRRHRVIFPFDPFSWFR